MDPVPPVMIGPECWSAVHPYLAPLLLFLRDITLQVISCPMPRAMLVLHLWKYRIVATRLLHCLQYPVPIQVVCKGFTPSLKGRFVQVDSWKLTTYHSVR